MKKCSAWLLGTVTKTPTKVKIFNRIPHAHPFKPLHNEYSDWLDVWRLVFVELNCYVAFRVKKEQKLS